MASGIRVRAAKGLSNDIGIEIVIVSMGDENCFLKQVGVLGLCKLFVSHVYRAFPTHRERNGVETFSVLTAKYKVCNV